MINNILKPKSPEDVLEAIRNIRVASYRLSSFLKLIDPINAEKIENWVKTVFHEDPKNMDVKYIYDDQSLFGKCFSAAVNCDNDGYGFSSNSTYKIIRWNTYYIFPREDFGKIIIKFMKDGLEW